MSRRGARVVAGGWRAAWVAGAVLCGACGDAPASGHASGSPPADAQGQADAADDGPGSDLPDAVDVGPDPAADDNADDNADADLETGPVCEATDDVETVAARWRTETDAAMAVRGLLPTQVMGAVSVPLGRTDYDALVAARTLPPSYFGSEADVLALPEDDPIRQAYLSGDIAAPDWSESGLLAYWDLEPYTDTRLYGDGDALVVAQLRLEACLDGGAPPDPPPREQPTRWVGRVSRATAVTQEVSTAWFRIPAFPPDPAWQRDPLSPFINRAGGGAAAVETPDGLQLWVEGYSGASGFLFRATSADGASWDFAWDDAHLCTFEGMADIEWYKTAPAVRFDPDDGTLTMWFRGQRQVGAGGPALLYRTTSADGLHWAQPLALQGLGLSELSPGSVVRDADGRYHLYAHRYRDRAIVHAVSDDGQVWEDASTVMTRGEGVFDLDSAGVFQPFVVRDGDRWLMFYTAVYSPREGRDSWMQPIWYQMHVALATSPDGLTWTRSPTPLLSQVRSPGHWESGSFGHPLVLPRGDGDWLMLYTGEEGGEPSVGRATASGWAP